MHGRGVQKVRGMQGHAKIRRPREEAPGVRAAQMPRNEGDADGYTEPAGSHGEGAHDNRDQVRAGMAHTTASGGGEKAQTRTAPGNTVNDTGRPKDKEGNATRRSGERDDEERDRIQVKRTKHKWRGARARLRTELAD